MWFGNMWPMNLHLLFGMRPVVLPPSITTVAGAWKLEIQMWEQVEKGNAVPGMETAWQNILSHKLNAAGITNLIVELKKPLV